MNLYVAHIYIDGSCPRNPGGSGGIAGILEMPDSIDELVVIFQEGYDNTTNNRMEMRALIQALEWVKKNALELKRDNVNEVDIWSDSNYTLNRYKYGEVLRTNGWINNDGIHAKNIDLIRDVIRLKSSVNFSCKPKWIQGKSNTATKKVDGFAKEASKRIILKKDIGYIKPKVSKTIIKGATNLYDIGKEDVVIRIFERELVTSRKDSMYKIKFEILHNGKTEKYFAYASKGINNLLHRWHFYRISFEIDSKNTIIKSAEEVKESEFSARCK
ncbi:MAG: RNase H family protein [candidate division Zixibacteria bacterium]|nr:RNase H family protein [candidate division Zixibacteria bacterium]